MIQILNYYWSAYKISKVSKTYRGLRLIELYFTFKAFIHYNSLFHEFPENLYPKYKQFWLNIDIQILWNETAILNNFASYKLQNNYNFCLKYTEELHLIREYM